MNKAFYGVARWFFAGLLLCAFQVQAATSMEQYDALLKPAGPEHLWQAPDQRWLIMAQAKNYPALVPVSPQSYFSAVGKNFSTTIALEKDTQIFESLQLINLQTHARHQLTDANVEVVDISWSPLSDQIALVIKQQTRLTLWRYQIATQSLSLWSDIPLSSQFNARSLVWLPDGQTVIVRASRSQVNTAIAAPVPILKRSSDTEAVRLYRDALDTPERRQIFTQLNRQQAVLIQADASSRILSEPAMLEAMSVSPDGRYLLLQSLAEDLHPEVKFNRLARDYRVIELVSGFVQATAPPLEADTITAKQADAAPAGARKLSWLPSAPASLIWIEAIETKGHTAITEQRDSIKLWPAPFSQPAQQVLTSNWRIFELSCTPQGRLIYSDFHAQQKQLRLWSWESEAPQEAATRLIQYDYTDTYADPGQVAVSRSPLGYDYAVANASNSVYLTGVGQTHQGQSPFVKRYDLNKKEAVVIFQSPVDTLQKPLYIRATDRHETLLITSETAQRAPVLQRWQAGNVSAPLYDWHTPELPVKPVPQHLSYQRADGVELSADLYLPTQAGQEKLPVLIWIYPKSYYSHSQQQRKSSPQQFTLIEPLSPLVALLEGVAVLDASYAPIVTRKDEEPNDSFIEQQGLNALATIQALEKTGQIDTSRMLLMGHSYGAFSALSLLATTDHFAGAIARSGAYNRSLTPIGFQSEKRPLWEIPDLYRQLSPFFQANRIAAPTLLIHGTEDQNPGTSVLQSELMFQALQSNGNNTELLLLPQEGHEYETRDNILAMLHTQARWIRQRINEQKTITPHL
jgi:dipeptidyl aminopeptidase/acylaminoacyl peptidase